MGCFFSGPLQKTSGQKGINASTYSKQNSIYPDLDDNPDKKKDQTSIRPFFSFTSFVLQNDNPTIFEWSFQKEIGKGAMSRVFLSTNTETGQLCAAKVYNKNILMRQTLGNEEPPYVAVQREIEIMASISHRYVLSIVEVIEDDCSNSLIMLLPFAEKGTLQSYINDNPPTEETLAICFFQIAEALRYVHSLNVVHRDLKPDNILVFSDTNFALSDFSVSTKIEDDDQKLVDTRGSPAFLSPEECGGEPFYPKPADVWAYGITLFSCAYNFLPFKLDQGQGKTVANTVFAVTQLLNTEELEVPEDKYSPDLVELLKQILEKDPAKRPTFEQIIQNPWFAPALPIDQAHLEEEEAAYLAAEEEEEQGENQEEGEAAE